jgi:hypothetical protein
MSNATRRRELRYAWRSHFSRHYRQHRAPPSRAVFDYLDAFDEIYHGARAPVWSALLRNAQLAKAGFYTGTGKSNYQGHQS